VNQREVIGEVVLAPQNVDIEHILGDGRKVEAESVQGISHLVRLSARLTVFAAALLADVAAAFCLCPLGYSDSFKLLTSNIQSMRKFFGK